MNRDVKSFVDSCDQCQRTGTPSFRNHWPLTPIIPLAPFEKWGIDFIRPISLVSTQKKGYIILATDYATKSWLSRGRFQTDGRTDDQTMAARASVTWTHCSVLFEVTWG
jgi:hypothetical protein